MCVSKEECSKLETLKHFGATAPSAPLRLATLQPDLDFLTLDYLAEVSLSIMAVQREKEPQAGYARDFVEVVKSLIPLWLKGSRLKWSPTQADSIPKPVLKLAASFFEQLVALYMSPQYQETMCFPFLKQEPDQPLFANLETGEPLRTIVDRLAAANAYLGAKKIAETLQLGAQIVITGRVADPSLTVGPCLAHYGWQLNDYDKIAGATVAGHLIECGTQVTGGISTDWLAMKTRPR